MKDNIKIGFIGQGFIGGNMANDFEKRGYNIVRYDLEKFPHNKELIQTCDYVFIAVPTPTTPQGFNCDIIFKVMDLIGKGKTAIIKSTIKVGTTDKLQKIHNDKYIIHSPEFLTEKNAENDTKYPERNVVGYTQKSKEKADKVLNILPKAKFNFKIKAKEAELVKYMGNTLLMTKVLFSNIFYNIAEENKVDYNKISNVVGHDSRIGLSHLKIKHQSGVDGDLGRGAGGHCFIKDMATLIEMASECNMKKKENKLGLEILKKYVEFNNYLLTSSKKDLDLLKGIYNIEDNEK
ncbi:hypothetical protein K9M50_00650 [Patescibacteria group bacterium]|nr:hypothetical protein [Patescibacteria group bacterium]